MASSHEPSEAHASSLPSFFVIGPPRTGTTWVQEILQHRAWLADPVKETRFFDNHFHRGFEWYRHHYRGFSADRPIGEIAPTYFASPVARERIAQLIPHAKVVCTFRNPVDRVISLYRLKRAFGLIPWDFDQALDLDPELIESGRYSLHLAAWQEALGNNQVCVMIYDDLRRDPQEFINRITDFIGVTRISLTQRHHRFVLTSETMTHPRNYHWTRGAALLSEWSRARQLGPMVAAAKRLGVHKLFLGGGPTFQEIPGERVAELYALFRPDVEKLESQLNRDLTRWKNPPVHADRAIA